MGDDGKQDGMGRAQRHADPYWWACMLESAKLAAERKPYLNADDVVRMCRERHPNVTTHENRANGPLMRTACQMGYFIPTDDWVVSGQRQNHKRPMMVWYSLIYKGVRVARPRRRPSVTDPRQYSMSFD
jgi:hypothetical protein